MKQILRMTSMKKCKNITEEVKKKYPCLCNKVDSNYRNEKVQKRLWTAIGGKLEVEGKATRLYLKKPYKKFEEIYISFYACYSRMSSSELSKQI